MPGTLAELYGAMLKQEPQGILGAARVNPLMMAKALRQQEANPRPALASLMNYPQTWQQFGDNIQANYPTDSPAAVRQAAFEAAKNAGPLIVSPQVAATLNTAKQLPESQLFADAVQNTPNASIEGGTLRLMLQRKQMSDQGLQPSVRGGVFYLPEGSSQIKNYTGKNGYGGQEKISGETMISNPLFVKGATGGKAPESAYDELVGKGAYQQMRDEALKVYGGYGATADKKAELARAFLSKYAPELESQASYIVRNSGEGNQLAYALQEAAVGSAVRKAGHDAVLGYSVGRGAERKPFLSEVFDVREMNYPDKFGTPTKIWDTFKK